MIKTHFLKQYCIFLFFSDEKFCHCTYVLEVELGDLVEFVLIDEGYAYDVSHPFHLHGHR